MNVDIDIADIRAADHTNDMNTAFNRAIVELRGVMIEIEFLFLAY